MTFQKIISSLFFLFLIQAAFGQTQRGQVPLGGSISGGFTIDEFSSRSNMNLSVESGYFVTDHLLLIGLIGGGFTQNNSETLDFQQKNISFGVGGRYYWTENRTQPFIGLELQHNINRFVFNSSFTSFDLVEHSFITDIKAGVSYFINEDLAFEAFVPLRLNLFLDVRDLTSPPSTLVNFAPLHTIGIGTSFRVFLNKL